MKKHPTIIGCFFSYTGGILMTEDIVFNITANVSELEHQLANIESKYSATNLAERFMESKTNLKSLHSMVENELRYNSGTYQNLPQGLKTPLMDNFEPIIGQIKSLQELLKAPSDTDNFFSSINTQVGYLTASVHSVIDGVKNLKTATASLSSDQLNTLSKNIPDLTRALTRTASNFLGIRGSGAATIGALSSSFMNNEINKAGYNKLLSNIHFTNDKTAQKALLESIAQVTVPTYMQGRYYDMARKYSSGVLRDRIEMNKYTSFRDRLPQSLKDIPSTPVTMSSDKIAKAYHEVLSEKEFSNFVDLARSNNSVRNALVELGYGKYGTLHGKAGSFNIVPRENFTKQSMATIVDNILYRQLKPALEGNPIYYTSWGAEDERGKTTIANRGNKLAIDAYEALPILQQITGDLAPLHLSDAKQKFSSGAMTVSAGQVKRGSRESYVVPALTYSDFKNAKMPENDRVVYDDKTTNGLDGKSYFVSLQRSRMTELAGMKGNNTFGNGIIGNIAENPEMAKGLPMLMIDFSSNVLEKDKDGNLSWTKNGDLVRNKETEKAITDLLTPKKYFNYNYNGKAREYWYPAITRKNADNEEETYVPVSVKNGKAILISEEQYAKESKSYLENYGRNIFDNYADPDFKYEYLENANKVFEGRNRLLTPSVPFAEVGGRIPKSDKTAVVDMKAAFGIDGSMFMMPGYIPGGNAVIRMPALNLKGAAQSFDFKSAIKENYGLKDGQPFYVPGLNTPEELLGLYKSGKLKTDPTYGGAEYQKTMDKYFVDIMKYDALISDSLIKSPLFTKVDGSLMYGEEANKFLQERLKKASAADLYRLVETAEEHSSTRQTALSAQASQHLIMSNEDVAINEKKWDDYILKLAHDVNFQKEHIFNGTDALSIAFREDPTIRKTNSAVQTKINEAISTAIQNRREGKLYGRNSLSMQMALVNPFYFLSQVARANGLKGGEKESAYMLSGGQIAGSSTFEKNSYGGFRYPVNAGELFALSVSQPYNEAIKNGKYGLSKYGLYMNPETIEKMGGGDFDGDQIQLTSGWIADVIKQTEEKINPEIEKQAKQLVKPEKQHLPMPGDGKMSASVMSQIVMRAAEASIHMGMVSNAEDAISQLDLSNPEVMQKYGRTIATLKQMYDVDSTYLKTGILAKFDKDTRAALHLGKPFSSIYKNLYSAIENSDITKFRKFSETNFPSIFDNRTSIMMSGGSGQYFHDDNIEKLIAAQRELEGITYDLPTDGKITTAEQARAVYLDKNIKIMSDVINRRAVVSNKSYDDLSSSLATWREKIDEEKKTLSKKNVTDLPRLEALSKQEREIRAQTGRLKALESMGLLQKNVEAGLGYAQYKRFDRSPLTEQYADFLSGAKEASNEKDLLNLRDFQARATTAIEADRIRQLNGAPLDVKTFFRTQQAYAIQQANDMTYSYSMLKKFKEDRARWYRQYVENIWDEPKNSSQFLGTAFHETAESFAKDLMAQQSDPNKRVSTPEELKKTFYKKLIEPDKQTHQVFFKEDNGKIKELTGKKTIDKKVELAAKTLELLPEILKDYEILGVEQSVGFHDTAPEKINSIDGSKVNTTGKVDLILRNRKTGMVNWLDWKPYDMDPNNKDPKHDALNQLLLYAGSDRAGGKIPAPDSLQALNYLNPDGLKTSLQNQFVASADIVKERIDEFNKDIIEVQTWAKDTGFNKLVMLNHKDVRLSDLNAGNILREKMKQEAMQNFLTQGIVPYGYTIPKAEEGPSSAEILGSQLQADRDRLVRSGFDKQDVAQMNELEVNQSLADVQRGDAAKKGTGKGIAAAMQFYKELNDWDDTLGKSIQEVMKRQYRITDERYNPWKSTQKALEEAEEKLDSFNTQGISPKDIEVRQTKLEKARQIRRNALLTVADGDMRKLKEDLDKAEISPKRKTATGSFADQYAALEKRIETAKQARDYVYGQVEWEDKNKGIVKKDSPITQTEWDKIANQEAELDKTVQSVRDRLVKDSAAVFDADIAKMSDVSKYGKLQTNTVIKNQLDSFARWKDDAFKQLELEYKDGYLTGNEKEYTRRKSMLDSIRQEDYENTLYAQEAKNSDKLLNQYNKFERRNNMRSGRNVYRQMLNRREDSIDALKNYKEAMSDKYAMWSDRANQIKADWQKENGTDAGHVGYMNLDSWKQASSEVQKYGAAIASVQKQLDSFGNKHTKIAAGAEAMIASMNNMITMYARRFARQLVQQAAQFVKQYDAAITEIQVVTRKSDEEVNQLGENMMKVAKDLKVSFSDVAKATTELYRQGLSDEEVDERREQVLKFSKVAGVSATDATKLITVGVNSGLFKDAKEVTDVVTALGDSAATNAGQIQKGIQKAGYAAKEAGVSGKELSAMLTVITAGTQLSGNVAGTTLRNVFSRINRVKKPGEVVYDEKGNAMTANTLAAVLNSAGISMYENGQMKGTTQILTDIGKVWDSLSDNKKNQIAYQLGGTQQYSNVSALMAGFSETDENGQTLMEKYLQLADESGNIVDEKYVDQADNLTAALTNLSNAFNALTSSVTDSEAIKGFVNMLAIALEGVAGLNTALSGVPALIAGIGVALVALSTIFSTHPVIAGALATIGALGTIYGLMTSEKPDYKKQTIEQITQMSSENEKKENKINELVNKIETINEKAQNGTATKEDLTQYNSAASELQSLGITSIKTASSLEELMANASDAATELGNAANSAKDLSAQNQGQVLRTGYNSMLNTLAQDALDMNREQSASENNRNATLSFLEDSFEPTDMENDEWIRWNDKLKEVWNNGEVDEERFNELLRDNPFFLNAEKYGDSNAINGVVSLIKSGVLDIDNVRLKNSYGTNSGIAQGMYIQGLTDEQLAIAASDPAIQLALFKYFYPQYGDYVDQDYALMDKITDAKTEYVEAKDSVSDIRRRAGKGVLDKRDSLEAASDSLYSYEDKIRALYSSYPSNEDFQNAILSQNTVLSEDMLRLIQDERVQDLALALLKDGKFGSLEDIRLENDHIISSALLPQSHILKGIKLSSLSDHDLKQVMDDPVMAKNMIAYLGEPLLNSESQEDFLDAIYPIEGLKEANLNASRAAINMHLTDDFFKNFSPKFDLSKISAPGLGDRNREYLESLYSKVPMIANSEYYAQILDSIVEELNQNPDKYIDKEHGNTVKTDALNDLVVGNFVTEDGMVSQDRINEYAKNHHFIVSEETANGENEQSFNLGAIATSAASLSTDNKYGNAAAKMYWKLLATDGTPAERFGSLMDMINNDRTLQPIVEAMISDSDHSELAKAFSYMFKSDSTDGGNYEIKEDLSDLDIAALMVALANADESGTLSAYNHQSKQVVSSNAMTVLKALRKNPEKISEEWGSLGKGNSIVAEMLRDNFSTILGEETTSKLLNGHLNDLGMNYAERMISAYGNESAGYTDYEYAGLAEQVLGGLDANLTPEAKLTYINSLPTEMIDALKEKISGFEDYVNLATMSAEGKANSGVTDAKVADARKAFELGISDAKIRDIEKYNENLDELATLLTQVGKGGKNAADAMQTINSKMDQNRYNRWALNQYKNGDRSETVTKQLSSGFGIDQAELKEASKSSADFFIKSMEQELEGQTTELNNTASIVLNEMWQDVRQTIPESFDLDSYIGIGGVFNVSGFLNACREAGIEIDAGWAALVANAAAHSATLRLTADGNKLSIDVSGTSAKPKSSGGGGGGKSDADKLVDKIKKGQALYEHRVKMVQYKQTEYTNADELTNYGRMIEKEMEIEQSYLPVVQENIQKLKEQMAKTKVGSDDWYTLRDAILSAEETYEEINKTLDENKKKLEENQQAILKLHTDLEDSVTEEIKNRIQKERDMTDGAVTMQETILNAIKQRHQDEWDLIKKDIEKKKEALEEEKSLIDERLQARKDAEDEAEKYEELAELKKQLASVEMDSSRTKDAAQLRKSIADLEKEIGWDIADKEADNAKNEIQDQMDAYDDYITKGDEDLEELLKDANNFSEEVNNVLKMNQSELFDWLKNNVKEYTESLKDAQQQMVNSWSDTYKQMMGLTDTYWDEVAEILSSKESYLEYMKNSDEYLNASDDMKAQLRYQWEDAYDKWILALKDTTNYDHFDNGLGDMSGSEYGTGTNSGTGAGGNKTTSPSGLSTMIKNAIDTVKKSLFGGLAWDKPNVSKEVLDRIVRGKFATGGVANYTGLAWLDGTPSKPERVLNAQQTESFERLVNVMDSLRASGVSLESLRDSMLDTRIHLPNLSPSIDPSTIGGNIANIGDINVTIEEAELNDDRDYDEIAQIVGEKFAKEISKQGINIAKYNF